MKFTVITILPELIEPSLTAGVVGRAREAGIITVEAINPRDFTKDNHRTVDDTPYGGGPGMVMKPEPLLAAIAKAMEATHQTAPSEQAITAAALRELDAEPDVLGQPTDPLAKVQRAIAKVESMLGGLEGAAGPLTASQLDDHKSSTVTEAEAAIAEIESALKRPVPGDSALGRPPSDAPLTARRPGSDADTRPIAMIDEDIDLRLPRGNERRGALGPAGDTSAASAAGDTEHHDEMPNLVERHNIVATPPAGVPIVAPPVGEAAVPASSASSSTPSIAPAVVPASSASSSTPSIASPAAVPASSASSSTPSIASPPVAPASSASSSTPSIASPAVDDAKASPSPSSRQQTISAPAATPATPHRILLSPSGKPLTQARVRELAALDHLILVCGRYEGVDQRVIDLAIDEELSIGDYVLSGGELGALVIIDAVARLIPGVLGEPTSADDESFSDGLLEYPQYTRPPEISMPTALQSDRVASAVPPVLQSGNHAAINAWRRQQSMQRTAARRPDLWRQFRASKADAKLFAPLRARTHVALVHHPIVDRNGAIVTSALTNFDIHDLARSTMTYGLAGYHIVTPITSQREKAEHIAKHWMADEQGEHRAAALRLIRTAESVDAAIAALTEEHGEAPTVVATSARADSFPAAERRTSSELLAEASLSSAPLLLLLGTGWGLADQLIPSVSRVLAPIEGASPWNHLSVRSAGAVILDRLFGRPA